MTKKKNLDNDVKHQWMEKEIIIMKMCGGSHICVFWITLM